MTDLSAHPDMTSSAFSPFAEYSTIKKPAKSTTFYSTKTQTTTSNGHQQAVAPVELIHSSDSVQALPISPDGAFRPIKQMSLAVHCSTPSASSSTVSMSSPGNRSSVQLSHQHGGPLRIPQPPYSRHSSSPSSSSSTPTPNMSMTRFPLQQNSNRASSTSIKPHIIGAGSTGNAASALAAALNAVRPDISSKTFNELVELARHQQQQIDANKAELEERQKLIATTKMRNGAVSVTEEQLRVLRTEIARDERELSHLSDAQKHARQINLQNETRRAELIALQETHAQDEKQIRNAVDKVDTLKKQLELLYRRRASAASAAIAQQRQINAFSSVPAVPPKHSNSSSSLSQRPQAQVGPFQVQRPVLNSSSDSEKLQFDLLDHPPVSGTGKHQLPIQQPLRLPQRGAAMKRPDKPPPPPKRNPNTVSLFAGSDTIKLLNNGVEQAVPPPYSALTNGHSYYQNLDNGVLRGRTDQLSIRNDSMKALKRRSWLQQNDVPEADLYRVLMEEQKKGRTHISFDDLHSEKVPSASKGLKQPEVVHFRNIPAAIPPSSQQRPKPIIEDAQRPVMSTFEKPAQIAAVSVSVSPKKEKVPSPKKEKMSESSVNTDPTNAELASKPVEHQKSPQKIVEEPKVVLEAVTVADKTASSKGVVITKPRQPPPPAPELEEALKKELQSHEIAQNSVAKQETYETDVLKLQHELPEIEITKPAIVEEHRIQVNGDLEEAERKLHEESEEDDHAQHERLMAGPSAVDDDSSASSSVDEDISSSSDVPVVFDEPVVVEGASAPKGILKLPGQKKHNKRIVFDPFVLFLDGALEGQLDTVKENASKINDVSRPNDEGITALHNAICACHYEIVKFLVDAKADVNALDSDGWSPLHCAASCNNLAMLKLLVEHGACIYATTLSDSEMPIRKCEEKEAGFDQCVSYLEMCDRWAGIVNNSVVYAAYDYDAENDDELTFKEGDALKVVSKEASDDGLWWLCECGSKKGLVPTNFIGLYPTLKVSDVVKFKHFEIPSQLPNAVVNSATKLMPIANELDLSGNIEISANA